MTEQHGYSMSMDYWKDNMVKPALFSPALQEALRSSSDDVAPDMVAELGASSGSQRRRTTDDHGSLPFGDPCVGLLNRSQGGIESLAKAIGALVPDSTLSPDHTLDQQNQTMDLIATLYIN
jgi:hypothetical protein